jgi:hypothetical protein
VPLPSTTVAGVLVVFMWPAQSASAMPGTVAAKAKARNAAVTFFIAVLLPVSNVLTNVSPAVRNVDRQPPAWEPEGVGVVGSVGEPPEGGAAGAGVAGKALTLPYFFSMYSFWQEQAWAAVAPSDSARTPAARAPITGM